MPVFLFDILYCQFVVNSKYQHFWKKVQWNTDLVQVIQVILLSGELSLVKVASFQQLLAFLLAAVSVTCTTVERLALSSSLTVSPEKQWCIKVTIYVFS